MALEDGVSVKIGADSTELQRDLETATSKLQSFGDKLSGIGAGMTAALTVPIAAIGAGAYKAFEALDEGLDMVRVKTGATGEALEGMGASFRNVLAGVPDSAHAVAIAFSEVAAKTGMVGEPLEKLTKNFLDLSRITGEDLAPLIANTSRLFGDWSVAADQQAASMDKVFRASQLTGQSFTGLAEKMVQYGAPLRQLGFSFDEAAAMIGKFQKEGVNTEIVLGAMRTALGKFAAAGKEPVAAFKELIEGIKNADTASGNLMAKEATNVKVFSDFAAAVREGRFEFDDLAKAIAAGSDTITKAARDAEDFAETWGRFRNQMTIALEPLGATLNKLLKEDLGDAFNVIVGVTSKLSDEFSKLSPTTQLLVIGMAALAAAAGPVLIALGAIATSVSALMAPAALAALAVTIKVIAGALLAVGAAWLVVQWWKWLADLAPVKAALGWLAEAIKTVIEWVMKIPGAQSAVNALGDAWAKVKTVMAGVGDSVKGAIKGFGDTGKAAGDAAAAHAKLVASVAGLEAKLKAAGIVMTQGNLSLADYEKKLRTAADALGTHGKASDEAAKAAKALRAEIEKIGKGIADMMSAWPKTGQWDFAAFKQAVAEGFKVETAIKAINEKISDLSIQFGDKMPAAVKQFVVNLNVARTSFIDFADRLAKEKLDDQFIKLSATIAKIPPDLKAAAEGLKLAASVDFSQIEGAAKSVRDMDAAAKTLGVTWDRDVNGALEKARVAFDLMQDGWRKGTVSTREYNLALVGYLTQQIEAAKKLDSVSVEGKKRIGELGEALDEAKKKVGTFVAASDGITKNFEAFGKQVSTILTDFSKDIGMAIVHWEGFGKAATKVWTAIKEAFVRDIIEGTFKELSKNISLVDFKFGELGKTVQKLFNNIAKLFGVGGTTAAGGAIEGAGGAAGGAGGGVGGAAGGFAGIVTAVSSAVSAVTGVLSYLQGRRMEQDIGRMEVTSREIKAELQNFRADAWMREAHWYTRTSDMWQTAMTTLQVLEQIRDVGIRSTVSGTDDQLFAMLDARSGQIVELLDGGFNATVAAIGTGTMNLWNLINGYTNKLLLSIAQATSMLYQVMAKPGFTGIGTSLPAISGSSGNNITNNVNLTTTSSDPNQLSRMVQNAITQAMGRL